MKTSVERQNKNNSRVKKKTSESVFVHVGHCSPSSPQEQWQERLQSREVEESAS